MPLYPYTCDSCGDFQDWQSMTACDQPAACPRCGTMSRRAVTAPTILGMDSRMRNAHMRNEKSAHEPRVVRADDWKPHAHHTHAHGATSRRVAQERILRSDVHRGRRRDSPRERMGGRHAAGPLSVRAMTPTMPQPPSASASSGEARDKLGRE